MKTKDLTTIALLLALGIVLKFTTDMLTRTVLFFFFIDPLLLITVLILIKYPKFKVAGIIAVIQTILSATLFMTTDMWFVRPFVVLIAYGVVKLAYRKKNGSVKNKYLFSCFFTSMLNILFVALVMIGILLFFPNLFPMAEIESKMTQFANSGLMSGEEVAFMQGSMKQLIIMSLAVLGTIFSLLPATIHLTLAIPISRVFKLQKEFTNEQPNSIKEKLEDIKEEHKNNPSL